MEGVQAHDDAGRATVENRSLRPNHPTIVEVRLICDFEGYVDVVVGVTSRKGLRVLELSGPARLVLDVEH
jgi:hypothetical protein